MLTSNDPDVPEKSPHIKQDDKFFSKLLTREANNPSFRMYNGGVGGSVPFMWESRPGTPKHKLCDNTLPPLTPPPSYYYFSTNNKKPIKKNPRSSLLYSLFPRINLGNRKLNELSSSTPSSSAVLPWSSSNSSSLYSVAAGMHIGSPRSVLCFGLNGGSVCCFGGCKKW